ncbi:hypothetical protein [Puerhibacterium sp. TATVAM-FAB25]|uniref:hypothetical protein n=1 Tax=Puerhibacterium sp. TATVAM-FAB25 TaxID=3093699 RepID=UPI00397DC257
MTTDARVLPRLDDEWFSIDRPVLLAIAQELKKPWPTADASAIARSTNLPLRDVVRAGFNLADRYIDVINQTTNDGPDWRALRLTEDGRREVGIWPNEDAAVDRFIAALIEVEKNAQESEKPKIRQAREAVTGLGRDVLVDVVSAFITGRMTM